MFSCSLSVLLMSGCTASSPDFLAEPTSPGQSSFDESDPPSKPVIVVDRYTSETKWGAVPITGTVTPGATVIYDSPASGERVVPNVTTEGTFCVNVDLEIDKLNQISFWAISGNERSNLVQPTVIQTGVPPELPTRSFIDSENLAAGAVAEFPTGNYELGEGQIENLTDGNKDSFVEITENSIRITSGSLANQYHVRLNDGGGFLQTVGVTRPQHCSPWFRVFQSGAANPNWLVNSANGIRETSQWEELEQFDVDGRTVLFRPAELRPFTRWLAIWSSSSDTDCNGSWNWPYHPIAEVEAYAFPQLESDSEGPAEVAPTCENGLAN